MLRVTKLTRDAASTMQPRVNKHNVQDGARTATSNRTPTRRGEHNRPETSKGKQQQINNIIQMIKLRPLPSFVPLFCDHHRVRYRFCCATATASATTFGLRPPPRPLPLFCPHYSQIIVFPLFLSHNCIFPIYTDTIATSQRFEKKKLNAWFFQTLIVGGKLTFLPPRPPPLPRTSKRAVETQLRRQGAAWKKCIRTVQAAQRRQSDSTVETQLRHSSGAMQFECDRNATNADQQRRRNGDTADTQRSKWDATGLT